MILRRRSAQCNTVPSESRQRWGAAAVEFAITLPVFLLLLGAMIEFGHAYMVIHLMNSSARKAARLGSMEGVTTAEVTALAESLAASGVDVTKIRVLVKDASTFDTPQFSPGSVTYASLPNVDLTQLEARQLFLVRLEVDYKDVAIFGPNYLSGIKLFGQSVVRHE